MTEINSDQKKAFLRTMLRIRLTEEYIDNQYLDDEMKTPVHLYIGQEAIATGVCATLNNKDYIQSNHRSHGHYLAKGGDLKALVAELFCKATGCSGAFGGSMHLVDKSIGHLGSSAIVAGGISLGTGHGLAVKLGKQDAVSVVFLGDGASESGVFYESVNFAILKKLPVIYILENNLLSVCSHISKRQVCDNVFLTGINNEDLYTAKIYGNDPELVYKTTLDAVNRAKQGLGPALIQCDTYRVSGHAGCSKQDAVGYRDKQEEENWLAKCPVKNYREKLLQEGVITEQDYNNLDRELRAELDEAFAYARKSPLPDSSDLAKYLYS